MSHISWGCRAKPVVGENAALSKVGPVVLRSLDSEVPVGEGYGGIDGLQGLLEHEGHAYVSGRETRSIVPMITVPSTPW